jgi:hypothetical protein
MYSERSLKKAYTQVLKQDAVGPARLWEVRDRALMRTRLLAAKCCAAERHVSGSMET